MTSQYPAFSRRYILWDFAYSAGLRTINAFRERNTDKKYSQDVEGCDFEKYEQMVLNKLMPHSWIRQKEREKELFKR